MLIYVSFKKYLIHFKIETSFAKSLHSCTSKKIEFIQCHAGPFMNVGQFLALFCVNNVSKYFSLSSSSTVFLMVDYVLWSIILSWLFIFSCGFESLNK